MKKIFLLMFGVALLSNCAELEKYVNVGENATPQEKFRACALSEAHTKLKNGTLFSADMATTKNEIVNSSKLGISSIEINWFDSIISLNISAKLTTES